MTAVQAILSLVGAVLIARAIATAGEGAGSEKRTVDLAVRWGPVMQSSSAEDNSEAGERYVHASWLLDLSQTALVLVDIWDWHNVRTHRERAQEITHTRIAPMLEEVRKTGITVIHAPSPDIAVRYPQWVRYAGDARRETAVERLLRMKLADALGLSNPSEALRPILDSIPAAVKSLAPGDPAWPPPEFRQRSGAYAAFARTRPGAYRPPARQTDILDCVRPKPGEYVIASGEQLHRLLKDRKILHLLYAGFATNMCVQNTRDYSMEQMGRRGYNCILLRDCTTGIENAYTLDGLVLTMAAMLEIEKAHASATSSDLRRALALSASGASRRTKSGASSPR
jgi:nicotinamidase-related amidase